MTGDTARKARSGPGRWAGVSALALAFTGACVSPPLDTSTRNEDRAAPADAAAEPELAEEVPASEAEAPAPAPAGTEAPADFDEIQRALAANNAKLRALGVGVAVVEQGDGAPQAKPKDEPPATERKPAAPTGGAGGGSSAGPSTHSGGKNKQKPGAKPTEPVRDKQDKRKSSAPKGSTADLDDVEDPAPAKASPSPTEVPDPNAGAAGRCQQICDLSGISCSLGDQICELAERHPEEDDYVAACERAVGDCDAAKEACDVCGE